MHSMEMYISIRGFINNPMFNINNMLAVTSSLVITITSNIMISMITIIISLTRIPFSTNQSMKLSPSMMTVSSITRMPQSTSRNMMDPLLPLISMKPDMVSMFLMSFISIGMEIFQNLTRGPSGTKTIGGTCAVWIKHFIKGGAALAQIQIFLQINKLFHQHKGSSRLIRTRRQKLTNEICLPCFNFD